MSLTVNKTIDEISVVANGAVFFRETSRIYEDGNEIAKTYNRQCLPPGHDLTGVPANVAAICQTAWTQEVIDAYNAQLAANALGAN
jgi:hypothetical protein